MYTKCSRHNEPHLQSPVALQKIRFVTYDTRRVTLLIYGRDFLINLNMRTPLSTQDLIYTKDICHVEGILARISSYKICNYSLM